MKDNLENKENDGKWIKYEQGLRFRDYGSGFLLDCYMGDVYIYYTLDENGKAKVPRITIRMLGHNKIGSIEGRTFGKNIEPEMLPILYKKLEEFPERDKYKKKEYDMQLLTTIDNKVQKGFELTKEELRFLYEVDGKIEGFSEFFQDPRIEEIKSKRNLKRDLAYVFDCKEENIGTELADLNKENIVVYVGTLDLRSLTSVEGLKLPQIVLGFLDLNGLRSAEGLKLPQTVGYLNLSGLTSAEGLKLPQTVGELYLNGLRSAEGLELPQTVGKALYLKGLRSAEGLKLPQIVGGDLCLDGLTSAEGLKLPQTVGRSLNLNGLRSAEGLELPQTVGKGLYLNGLRSAEGLKLPQIVGGDLQLHHLTSAEGLKLPQTVGGELDLVCLTTAEGLKLPQIVGGDLHLGCLTSAEELELPQTVGKNLYLDGLTSAEGLKLPQIVGENLYLDGLTSAEGLKLPQIVEGDLRLRHLTTVEGLVLPENFSLEKLWASKDIKAEIENHPEKYYRNYIQKGNKESEDLSKEKEQILNAKHFTEETKKRLLEGLAKETDAYDGEKQNEYKGRHFR